jgi:hypothetical protein
VSRTFFAARCGKNAAFFLSFFLSFFLLSLSFLQLVIFTAQWTQKERIKLARTMFAISTVTIAKNNPGQ